MRYFICSCAIFVSFMIVDLTGYEIRTENGDTKALGYGEWIVETDGEFDLMKKIIRPDDTIFDVGANVGEWSLCALQLDRSINLHSFEPIPLIFSDLQQTLSDFPNAQVYNLALSNKIGRARFCYYNETYEFAGLSSFYIREVLKADHQPPKFIQVETDTLSHFCINHSIERIDFLKIDAEGAEWVILQGATNLIKQKRIAAIQFEYGGCYVDAKTTLEEIYDFLTKYGYLVFRIIPNGLIQITEWSPHLENFDISNYVAIDEDEISNRLGKICASRINKRKKTR